MFEAASLGDVERLAELLDADPSSATAYSADGFTALHFPAFFGGIDVRARPAWSAAPTSTRTAAGG